MSADFIITAEVYSVVEADLAALRHHSRVTNHVTSRVTQVNVPCLAFGLRIQGEDGQAVVKMRSAIEQVLAGAVAMNGDRPVWHDFFLHPEGSRYLEDLWRPRSGFAKVDPRRMEVRVYGSARTKEEIVRKLIVKCEELGKADPSIHSQQTLGWIWRTLQDGLLSTSSTIHNALSYLSVFQKHATKALFSSTGKKPIAQTTNGIAGAASLVENLQVGNEKGSCAVCWAEPDEPHLTLCGHVYCSGCLKNQCAQISYSLRLPLHCLGDQGKCSHVFEMSELEQALPGMAFEDFLRSSFDCFIRSSPEKLQFCSTADCPQIYRVSTDAAELTCPTCHLSICTACGAASHEGLTCSEHKEWSAAGIVDFHKWMEDNKFKPCPKCKVAIEKTDGCNHMTCRGCSTDFCWICLTVFNRAEIYAHMNAQHGNIGLEDENGDGHEEVAMEVEGLRL